MKAKKSSGKKSARRADHPFRIFRLPPRSFDLRRASARERTLHGIPQPPSAETHPRLRLLWEEMADRRPRFVEPTFRPLDHFHRTQVRDQRSLFDITPDPVRPYLNSLWRRVIESDISISKIPTFETSTNWCGGYVSRPLFQVYLNRQIEPLRVVAGRWTVPSVSLPNAAYVSGRPVDGTYIAAVWVGIDGWKGTSDVFQAGTNSTITVTGGKITGINYYAWTEWFGFPWSVQSLTVTPGDLISCIVCAPFENNHGTAILNNLTTNESAIYGIDAPSNTTLIGNVAEWIVEDPSISSTKLYPFANFGQVVFTNCSANTQSFELDLSNARFIDLVDSAGNPRAQSYYQTRSSLKCQFVK